MSLTLSSIVPISHSMLNFIDCECSVGVRRPMVDGYCMTLDDAATRTSHNITIATFRHDDSCDEGHTLEYVAVNSPSHIGNVVEAVRLHVITPEGFRISAPLDLDTFAPNMMISAVTLEVEGCNHPIYFNVLDADLCPTIGKVWVTCISVKWL